MGFELPRNYLRFLFFFLDRDCCYNIVQCPTRFGICLGLADCSGWLTATRFYQYFIKGRHSISVNKYPDIISCNIISQQYYIFSSYSLPACSACIAVKSVFIHCLTYCYLWLSKQTSSYLIAINSTIMYAILFHSSIFDLNHHLIDLHTFTYCFSA